MVTTADVAVASLLAAVGGIVAAYLDVTEFFKEKRISTASVLTCPHTLAFFGTNGGLAAVLALWSFSGSASSINAALGIQSPWMHAFVIGLGFPALVRSKLFSWTSRDGDIQVGPEAVYARFRDFTLHGLHQRAIIAKDELSEKYAKKFKGQPDVAEAVGNAVLEEAKPFRNERQLEDLRKEFDNYQERFAGTLGSEKHLEKIIRWALDTAGIAFVTRRLDAVAAT